MRLSRAFFFALSLGRATPALAAWPLNGIVVNDNLSSHAGGAVAVVSDGGNGVLVHSYLWHETSRVDPEGAVLWRANPFIAAGLPEPSLYNPGDSKCSTWRAGSRTFASYAEPVSRV